jgi:hypothetical protein
VTCVLLWRDVEQLREAYMSLVARRWAAAILEAYVHIYTVCLRVYAGSPGESRLFGGMAGITQFELQFGWLFLDTTCVLTIYLICLS